MRDYRCRKCGHLLFRSNAGHGQVQALCSDRRCRTLQVVRLGDEEQRAEPAIQPTREHAAEPGRLTASLVCA